MAIFRENSKPPKPLFSENKTLLHEPQLLRLRQQRLQWTKKRKRKGTNTLRKASITEDKRAPGNQSSLRGS